jgi:hypothetical protein
VFKTKIAFIIVRLLKKANKQHNENLEREIFQELAENLWKIPWADKIEKVTVLENGCPNHKKRD